MHTRRGTARRLWSILFILASLPAASAAQSGGYGPQGVVRRFCELDSLGQRVSTGTWPAIEPLVEWPLEPVWDHAVLIAAYQVGPPRAFDFEKMVVDVHYSVVARVTANGQGDEAYVEKIRLLVRPDENGNWRVMGPPPAPHLFAHRIDVPAARRAVQPGQSRFPTNSDFVWQMFRHSGWDIPYEPTADLALSQIFRRVNRPKSGDLVLYLRDEVPYHVGILEDESHIVSATINAGIMRTPLEMFAGDVRYLRLSAPPPAGTETAVAVEATATAALSKTATATPKRATPTAATRKPTPKATAKPAPKSTRKPTPKSTPKKSTLVKPRRTPSRKAVPRKPTPKAGKRRKVASVVEPTAWPTIGARSIASRLHLDPGGFVSKVDETADNRLRHESAPLPLGEGSGEGWPRRLLPNLSNAPERRLVAKPPPA